MKAKSRKKEIYNNRIPTTVVQPGLFSSAHSIIDVRLNKTVSCDEILEDTDVTALRSIKSSEARGKIANQKIKKQIESQQARQDMEKKSNATGSMKDPMKNASPNVKGNIGGSPSLRRDSKPAFARNGSYRSESSENGSLASCSIDESTTTTISNNKESRSRATIVELEQQLFQLQERFDSLSRLAEKVSTSKTILLSQRDQKLKSINETKLLMIAAMKDMRKTLKNLSSIRNSNTSVDWS